MELVEQPYLIAMIKMISIGFMLLYSYTPSRDRKCVNDVKFEVYGFGGDQKVNPFENKFPEERFYNRTVIIDIIPQP